MSTVFSHIVRKRLSQEAEDVATEALAFIVESSEAARRGFTEFLRRIEPDIPSLCFRTQQTEDSVRPDMWGFDDSNTPRVFVENKFWAGLTENQPVSYLELLRKTPAPSILLFVVPEKREETVWWELKRRVGPGGFDASPRDCPAGIAHVAKTAIGPTLALTSWEAVLSAMRGRLTGDPRLHDLEQLWALSTAVDSDAFIPISSEELTDQRTPAFVLQMNTVVEKTVAIGVARGILSTEGLRPSSSWERTGRYISFPTSTVGAWLGIEFRLWRDYGQTPIWLVFSSTDWGRSLEVRALLEPWADREGVVSAMVGDEFAVGIDVAIGEEKDFVVDSLVRVLGQIGKELKELQEGEGED